MSRRRRNSSGFSNYVLLLVAIVLVLIGSYKVYKDHFTFNPQQILAHSILKEKTFESKVIEVVSPQNKIKAYLIEDNTNPIISISFLFKNAGLASDDEGKLGLSNVVSELLIEGAGELDSQALKEKLEDLAIGISFDSGLDDFSGALIATAENQDEAYKLLSDILSKPQFADNDLERIKLQMQNAFLRQKEHPASILSLESAKFIYGQHPYSRNPLGNWDDISRFKRTDLQTFVTSQLTQNNLIVGVAGDISAEKLGTVLDDIFGKLPQNGSNNFVRQADISFDGRVKNISQKTGQNMASFVVPGVSRSDPDFYPLYVANQIIGGSGLSSRLSKAAREKEGLTYSIYSYMSLADKSPLVQGGFSSTADKYEQAMSILKKEWETFGQKGATDKEVDDAKNYLISSYNLRFSSVSNLADNLMYMQKENLGLDFLQTRNEKVRRLTKDDINKAAKKYFRNDNMIFVNIGQF